LRAVGAITAKQLKTALALSVETGLPVGWVLASQGTINQSLLVSAITAQRLCDRNLIGQDDALNYLRMARMQQKPIRKLLKENNVSTQEVDTELLLGHLLVESGVLVRTELLAAQEFALLSNKDLGPMLLDLGMLEKKAWNTAEAVFARVIGASIPTAQAIELLHKLKRLDWNMDQLASPEDGASPIELGELIGLAGLVPAEKLQSAIESSRQGHRTLATFLTDDALIEAGILAIVEKCKSAIESRLLNLQKAVILLTYCSDNRCSLEEALAQFGWTMA
jgi:hypothetical protein